MREIPPKLRFKLKYEAKLRKNENMSLEMRISKIFEDGFSSKLKIFASRGKKFRGKQIILHI